MILSKVLFQRVVIHKILLLPPLVISIADMASFMFISAVGIELIISIETLSTKTTLGMPFEAALVHGTRIVVTKLFMFSKFLRCEEFMFVRKDLLVPCAKITHHLMMHTFDMTV